MRQKFLTEKRCNASLRPSLFSIIFFDAKGFVEHRRVPLRSLSVLWDSKLSMEYRDITFSSKKFSIPEFSDTLRGSPTKFFVTVRPQIFHRKSWYSPVRHNFSLIPETFWNKEAFLYELIWYCETKQFDGKSLYSPPLLSLFFFDTRIFVELRRVPLWSFSVLRENIFSMEDRDITFSSRKFSIPCFDDTLMGSPTKISPQWDNKFSIENRYTLFSGMIFFDTRTFLKHRSFPLRNHSVLWDKTIWRKIVVLASSLIVFFFSITDFFSNTEGVLYEFFTHSETESFDRKTW